MSNVFLIHTPKCTMFIVKKPKQLTEIVHRARAAKQKIGFVPTMGALHNGHLSLIQSSKAMADLSVCSIFINPTQFNNPDDFKHYPITIERDIEKLAGAGCDLLFLPEVTDIYPEGFQARIMTWDFLKRCSKASTGPGTSRVYAR